MLYTSVTQTNYMFTGCVSVKIVESSVKDACLDSCTESGIATNDVHGPFPFDDFIMLYNNYSAFYPSR